MNSHPSGISVVTPTHGRVALVERMLESLSAAGDRFAGDVEIILVDDSEARDAHAIESACLRVGCARYERGPASVRAKRNIGVERARHPVVLFVDSDCQAHPDLIREHAKSYENHPGVAGVVGVTEFVGRESWMWEVIQASQFLNAFSFAKRMESPPWATCSNTSYRRDLFEEIGGFETAFPFRLGGDDVDFGLRLYQAGQRLVSNPDAVVEHARETWDSFPRVWRRVWRWGRMDLHLYYHRYPERISMSLPRFSTLLLALVCLAIAGAIRNGRALLLLVPFFWAAVTLFFQAIWTVRRSGQPLRRFPVELMADVLGLGFEFGTMFEGLRHGDFTPLNHNVRRGPVLPVFEQHEWIIQQWSMAISLLIVFGVVMIL